MGGARNDDGISRRSRKLNINTKEQGADPDWLPAAVSSLNAHSKSLAKELRKIMMGSVKIQQYFQYFTHSRIQSLHPLMAQSKILTIFQGQS